MLPTHGRTTLLLGPQLQPVPRPLSPVILSHAPRQPVPPPPHLSPSCHVGPYHSAARASRQRQVQVGPVWGHGMWTWPLPSVVACGPTTAVVLDRLAAYRYLGSHLQPPPTASNHLQPPSPLRSYLKALAGRHASSPNLKVSGDIRYNGHAFEEFNVVRTAAYVGQVGSRALGRGGQVSGWVQ